MHIRLTINDTMTSNLQPWTSVMQNKNCPCSFIFLPDIKTMLPYFVAVSQPRLLHTMLPVMTFISYNNSVRLAGLEPNTIVVPRAENNVDGGSYVVVSPPFAI